MLRPTVTFALVALLALSASAQVDVLEPTVGAKGQHRVALVIGNARYQHRSPDLSDLPTSVNDARDLTDALRGFGFTVLRGTDLSKGQMRTAVRQFGRRAEGANAALFFYSGHGMQDPDGETNYLIPSGADPRTTAELIDQGYNLGAVLAELGQRDRPPALSIFLVDACRTQLPTPGQMGAVRGYTPDWDESVTGGVRGERIVVHATQSGQIASAPTGPAASEGNSFFTRALLDALSTASTLDVNVFFPRVRRRVRALTARSQDPHIDGNYPAEFTFALPPGPSPAQIRQWLADGEAALNRNEYAVALPLLTRAAEAGDPVARNWLGRAYSKGWGVDADDRTAVRYYRLAADQGNAAAQSNLGSMYDHGRGVNRDYAEAHRLYRLAADQGNAGAQSNLGYVYRHGLGVDRDYAEAVRLYRLAADQGNVAAMMNLGRMYENGLGVLRDLTEARRWYERAAAQGDGLAAQAVERLGDEQ